MRQTPLRQRLVGGVTAGLQVGGHLNLHHTLSKLRSVQRMCWSFHVKRHKEKLESTRGLITLKKKLKLKKKLELTGGLITLKESNSIPTFIAFLLLNIF